MYRLRRRYNDQSLLQISQKMLIVLDDFNEVAGLDENLTNTEILSKAEKLHYDTYAERTSKILLVRLTANENAFLFQIRVTSFAHYTV